MDSAVFGALHDALLEPDRPLRVEGFVVFSGAPRRLFGMSWVDPWPRSVHVPEQVRLAWRGGVLLGSVVLWVCGRSSPGFQLMDTAPHGFEWCGACMNRPTWQEAIRRG